MRDYATISYSNACATALFSATLFSAYKVKCNAIISNTPDSCHVGVCSLSQTLNKHCFLFVIFTVLSKTPAVQQIFLWIAEFNFSTNKQFEVFAPNFTNKLFDLPLLLSYIASDVSTVFKKITAKLEAWEFWMLVYCTIFDTCEVIVDHVTFIANLVQT